MTKPAHGTGPRRVAGAGNKPVPQGRCPKCTSTRILGPRLVKDDKEWCNCYDCGHEWQTNRAKVRKGDKPRLAGA